MNAIHARRFTYASAQNRTIVVAVSAILVIETTVLHLWLAPQHARVAWLLTALSLATLAWLWRDDVRYRAGEIRVAGQSCDVQLGARWVGTIPRELVEHVTRPTWKDLPEPGNPTANDYANLTKPADPNVLIVLREPVALRAFGLVDKKVRRIGVHLDAPDDFLSELTVARTSAT